MSDDLEGGSNKSVIWAIVLGIAGLVCFLIGVILRWWGLYILALALLGASAVILLVRWRRSTNR